MLSLWWMESHGRLENFPIASAAPYGLSTLVFIPERSVKMIKFGVLCYISATQALPGTVCHWLTGTIWHRVFYFIFLLLVWWTIHMLGAMTKMLHLVHSCKTMRWWSCISSFIKGKAIALAHTTMCYTLGVDSIKPKN